MGENLCNVGVGSSLQNSILYSSSLLLKESEDIASERTYSKINPVPFFKKIYDHTNFLPLHYFIYMPGFILITG